MNREVEICTGVCGFGARVRVSPSRFRSWTFELEKLTKDSLGAAQGWKQEGSYRGWIGGRGIETNKNWTMEDVL